MYLRRTRTGTVFPSFHVPLLAGLLNGDLTVSIFFALSGYVLTRHRWGRNDNPNIISTLLRRYMRLELPILASVAVVLVLMLLGMNFAAPIGQLIDRVWGSDYVGDTNNVDVHIAHLRAKIEDAGGARIIQTVRGVGYVCRA